MLVRAQAEAWRSRWDLVMPSTAECLALAPPGSDVWIDAVAFRLYAASVCMESEVAAEMIEALCAAPPPTTMRPSYAFATFVATIAMADARARDAARASVEAFARASEGADVASRAWCHDTQARCALVIDGDLGGALTHACLVGEGFHAVGDSVGLVAEQILLCTLEAEVGDHDAVPARVPDPGSELAAFELTRQCIAWLARGEADRAEETARALAGCTSPRHARWGRAFLARALLLGGDVEAARVEASVLFSEATRFALTEAGCLAAVAAVELAAGDAEAALARAEAGLALATEGACLPSMGVSLAWTRVEALDALGRPSEDALGEAWARLAGLRDSLPEARRARFLGASADYGPLIDLARARGVAGG